MEVKRFVLGDLMTNCYVASDEDKKECIIIDPAVYSEKICDYIEKNQLSVKLILLTHCHFDHLMGCNEFAEKYNVEVLISKFDGDNMVLLNKEFADLTGVNVKPYLEDGDEISFGNSTLKVLATPGHTPGSLSFYADGVLFSGDTLFKGSIGRTDFYMGNFADIEKSIKRIYNLPDETVVYSGHGFSTKIGLEKVSNPYVRGAN